jgi:hypothetical protein
MNRKLFKAAPVTTVLIIFCAGAAIVFGEQETPQQAVNRASQAYNNKWKGEAIKDWVGSGKIKILGNTKGPFNFIMTAKQKDKVKRVVKTADGSKDMMSSGSDGKKRWHNTGPFQGDATGSVGHFVDSQTSRAIARLFDDNNALKDLGKADNKFAAQSASSKVIEVKSSKGLATRYFIDNKSSLITRLEFETGEFYSLLYDKKKYPSMASYVFSDYRDVNGIPTPFKIAVYKGLVQIEEMTFTSVQYNTGVKDDAFVP